MKEFAQILPIGHTILANARFVIRNRRESSPHTVDREDYVVVEGGDAHYLP